MTTGDMPAPFTANKVNLPSLCKRNNLANVHILTEPRITQLSFAVPSLIVIPTLQLMIAATIMYADGATPRNKLFAQTSSSFGYKFVIGSPLLGSGVAEELLNMSCCSWPQPCQHQKDIKSTRDPASHHHTTQSVESGGGGNTGKSIKYSAL